MFVKITARKRNVSYSVDEAVTEAMNGALWRTGELERLSEQLDNHAKFVGALVKELVESGGVLRVDNLVTLLGYDYNVEQE